MIARSEAPREAYNLEGLQRSRKVFGSSGAARHWSMECSPLKSGSPAKGVGVRGGSIYGVTDDAKPSCLPTFSKGALGAISELLSPHRFPGAAEVRQSIEAHGYSIFGGKLTLTETERVVVGGRY